MTEYRAWSNRIITKEQAEAIGNYYIFKYQNAELREIYSVHNHILNKKSYVLWEGETHTDLFNQYYDPKYHFSIVEISILPFGIKVFTFFIFEGSSVKFVERIAFDVNDNIIATEIVFEPSTGIPDFPQTRKYFYDANVNPAYHLFETEYDENGSLLRIEYNSYHTDECGQDSEWFYDNPESLLALRNLTGISQELAEYYASPYVLPPSQVV